MEVGTSAFPPLSPSPLPKVSCTYTWAHAMVGHQEFSILCHFTTFVCCIKLSSEEKAGLEHIHPWRYTAGTCFPPGSRQLCLRLFMVLSFWSSPPFWRRIFPPCSAGPSAGWDRSLGSPVCHRPGRGTAECPVGSGASLCSLWGQWAGGAECFFLSFLHKLN